MRQNPVAPALALLFALLLPALALGQASDVDCNKCVDTADIAPGAIANARIADSAVNGAKIKNQSVRADDLANGAAIARVIADGAVTSAKLASQAVGGAALKNGSINFVKLATPVIESLLPERVIPVSASGTTTENCDELLAVLATITDAAPGNPYRVLVGPGSYDCAANTVFVSSHIVLEGSGPDLTVIFGTNESDNVGNGAVVNLAEQTELRSLSITNLATNSSATAVYAGAGGVMLIDVELNAGGASTGWGLYVWPGGNDDFVIRDSSIAGGQYGIWSSNGGGGEMHNSAVAGNNALFLRGSASYLVRASYVLGGPTGINGDATATAVVAHSQLAGGTQGNMVANTTCVLTYDDSYQQLQSNCSTPP